MEKSEEKVSDYGRFKLMNELEASSGIKRRALFPGSTVVRCNSGKFMSHFVMLEGIHFNMVYNPPGHLGYKAVVTTISGLVALGLKSGETTIVIGASTRFETSVLEKILEGAKMAGEKYKFPIISFDIVGSVTGLTISVSSLGTGDGKSAFNGIPAINDLICTTGNFGASFAGLQILERENKLFLEDKEFQPDLKPYSYVVGRQLKPELRSSVLDQINKANIKVTSSIPVIEGLASDLLGICYSRGVGARIYQDRIPIDAETASVGEEMDIEPLTMALNGGEDFEFLITASINDAEKIREIEGLNIIGYISDFESGCRLIIDDGAEAELTAPGW